MPNTQPDSLINEHSTVELTLHHAPTLPWDAKQFRKSDIGFIIVAVLSCVVVPFIHLPEEAKKIIERTVLAPIDFVPPEVKPIEKKEPPPPPKPKEKGGEKPEASKALPRAAAPDHPAPKPTPPSQAGSPDKPPVQTVRPAAATADAGATKTPATAVNPTPLPSDTPAAVSHQVGPTAAELKAAAQKRAQGLVAATGLGNAIGGLTNGTSASPKAVEGRGLLKGGVEGGRPDPKLGIGGGGTGGNGAAKTGVKFGSATDGDKTGRGIGSLSGKGTDDVSGGKIKGNGNGDSGTGKGEAGKGNRDDVNRVMNQNKGRLQGAYMRALNDDPAMEGAFTVHLKIAPDGHVISASVVSSDLNNSKLEGQLLAMIKGFDFSSGSFDTFEGNYKYNFTQ